MVSYKNEMVNGLKNPENRDKVILKTYPSTQNFTRKPILRLFRRKTHRKTVKKCNLFKISKISEKLKSQQT